MAKRKIEYYDEKKVHSLRPNKFWKIDLFKPQEFEEAQTPMIQEQQAQSNEEMWHYPTLL